MGIRAILLRARTRACAWAAVWAVLLSMVQTAPANVRLDLADLPPENRVGGFSETVGNCAGPLVAFVQYPRLENEPILAMTASGRLFWLSRDPLGEQADPLHNLYRFVGNNPLNYVDPLGLQCSPSPQTKELEQRAIAIGAGGAYVFSAAGPPSYKPGSGGQALKPTSLTPPAATAPASLPAARQPLLLPGPSGTASDIVVIGSRPDTLVAERWAGHKVLNIANWTIPRNDAFVASAIRNRQTAYLASPMNQGTLWDATANRPTVFSRELGQFFGAGYNQVGDNLLPGPLP